MEIKKLNEVKTDTSQSGVLKKVLLYSKNLMLIYYEIEPGCTFPLHSHPNEQMGLIIQGNGEFTIDEGNVPVEKGSAYYIRPSETHGFKTLGNEKCILLDIFHPPRTEHIPK